MALRAPAVCALRGGAARRRVGRVPASVPSRSPVTPPGRDSLRCCAGVDGAVPAVGGTRRRARAAAVVAPPPGGVEEALAPPQGFVSEEAADADAALSDDELPERLLRHAAAALLRGCVAVWHRIEQTGEWRLTLKSVGVADARAPRLPCSSFNFEIAMPPSNVEGVQQDCTGLTIEARTCAGAVSSRACAPRRRPLTPPHARRSCAPLTRCTTTK